MWQAHCELLSGFITLQKAFLVWTDNLVSYNINNNNINNNK